jgi:uncharacterized protein
VNSATRIRIDPLQLIDRFYSDNPSARSILLGHSRQVADLAVEVAGRLADRGEVDQVLIEEAALLHDIGMIFTDTPALGCRGEAPYIAHGIIGAELLQKAGLPDHARVCERHIGVGLSVSDIVQQQLPLPHRDMSPQSTEEMIVAYADLFFSKTRKGVRSVDEVRSALARHGRHKTEIFKQWHERFKA